jgi:hypothetical protein
MHKNTTECKQNIKQLVENKHGASKIIDTFATYQSQLRSMGTCHGVRFATNTQLWRHHNKFDRGISVLHLLLLPETKGRRLLGHLSPVI